MTLDEYARRDGVALAALVASRQVTPLELVDLAAAAAALVNEDLNVIAHDLTDLARETARHAVPRGAMFGVPFLVKDLALEMKGTPYEAGCRLLKGNVSTIDTNLMTRFREAGLITIGKTTCAEFGAQIATETVLNGITRNPWNQGYTPGGSSGGSAAAVAAGVVPVAHANDGIGSIRIPASNCGLFGLKPNRHRTPIGPVMGDAPGSRGVEFVVSRSVRDSAVLLDSVHGADTGAQAWAPPPKRRYVEELERPRTGLRIAVQTHSFSGAAVDRECADAVRGTALLCEALGHHVEDDAPKIDFAAFRRAIRDESNANSLAGLAMAAEAMGRPIDTTMLEPFTLAIYADGKRTSGEDVARAMLNHGTVQRQMGAFFERYDILLLPVLARPPAPIGWLGQSSDDYEGFWDRFCGDAYSPFAGVFNVTGHPAASLPTHMSVDGLPIGTMVVSRFGEEGTLFNLSAQIEQAAPWHHRVPTIHVSGLGEK